MVEENYDMKASDKKALKLLEKKERFEKIKQQSIRYLEKEKINKDTLDKLRTKKYQVEAKVKAKKQLLKEKTPQEKYTNYTQKLKQDSGRFYDKFVKTAIEEQPRRLGRLPLLNGLQWSLPVLLTRNELGQPNARLRTKRPPLLD